ncbi:MAG: hypothetical protein QN187_12215 [Armatimonadota bacterium]|nr:hypothetical protein [Armatimonadota bacterium]MDR7518626.1 hypothetical protein [Armatimonadota bacterium]MDR7548493.1 hypothetical protein [Armatimonadota bacterium]
MSSHFTAIGFPVREVRDYWALAQRAVLSGERVAIPGGRILVRWAPGGGPEVWAQATAAGEAVLATPFFATDETYRLALTGSGASDDEAFEGWIDGWLNPTEADEPYSGLFPLRVDVVNYAAVRGRLRPGSVATLRLAVILHEATLYPDAQAYDAVRDVSYRPPIQSFTSSIHFGVDESDADADATALVTGILREARELANAATGAAFWWMRVATAGVTISLVADREVLPVEPRADMVVAGSGWVLGEVLS